MTFDFRNSSEKIRISILAVAAIVAAAAAFAGEPPDEPFYNDIGGRQGVAALVDAFVGHLYSDGRIGPFFKDVDPDATRERLRAQFCDLSGGPCKTVNPDMKKTHSGLDIGPGDFDAVVELLKRSMEERAVPMAAREKLLRKLAPMRRDIVNAP